MMFDRNNKQYLIKLSSENVIHLFHDHCSGIQMRYLCKDGSWTEPATIAKWALPGFSTCLGSKGAIHLLCQDGNGTIILMTFNNGSWSRKSILKSKSSAQKHLQAITWKDEVYLFFTLEYSNQKVLTFQLLKNGECTGMPKAVDYIKETRTPYEACLRKNDTIFAFYSCANEEQKSPGYKCYDTHLKKWSNFNPLSSVESDREILCTETDTSGKLHLCIQRKTSETYQLCYYSMDRDSNGMSSGIILAESPQAFDNTAMVINSSSTKVYWIHEKSIFYRESDDHGSHWNDTLQYTAFEGMDLSCCTFIQKNEGENPTSVSQVLPGNLDKGLRLAFTPTGFEARKQPPADIEALKELITQTLQLFSSNINDLRNSVKNLNQKAEQLNAAQQQLELEISKCDIKDTLLEEEVKKIKISLKEIEVQMNSYKPDPVKNDASGTVLPLQNPQVDHLSEKKAGSIPLMPGTGFNSITPEFLKGLKKIGNNSKEQQNA